MNDDLYAAYVDASNFFTQAVGTVASSMWNSAGLGEWSLHQLVAHGNRAHTTVEQYLLHPQPAEPANSSYFSPESIAQRGRDSELALGDDPAAAVAAASVRVTALVGMTDPLTQLGTPAGTVSLAEYLPSRIAELVIHGLDVARVVGDRPELTERALEHALIFVARKAVTTSPVQALESLTGRGKLPEDYSVY